MVYMQMFKNNITNTFSKCSKLEHCKKKKVKKQLVKLHLYTHHWNRQQPTFWVCFFAPTAISLMCPCISKEVH